MSKAKDEWVFYVDKAGRHRWRLIAENKLLIGASSQGYASKQGAKKNAERLGYKPPKKK